MLTGPKADGWREAPINLLHDILFSQNALVRRIGEVEELEML